MREKLIFFFFHLLLVFSPRKTECYYILENNFSGLELLDHFDFVYNGENQGFTQFVGKHEAFKSGLATFNGNKFVFKVDNNGISSTAGRKSLRLESKRYYGDGLYVADLGHIPHGCGVCSSFTSTGPSPYEFTSRFTIFEVSNELSFVKSSIKTPTHCDMTNQHTDFDGTWVNQVCGNPSFDLQCTIASNENILENAFLKPPKANNPGGLFVMQRYSKRFIKLWFFKYDQVPSDLSRGKPNPETWKQKPYAHFPFGSHCNVENLSQDHRLVLQTVFCGQQGPILDCFPSHCGRPGTFFSNPFDACKDFVKHSPGYFRDAYWEINNFEIYREYLSPTVYPSTVHQAYYPNTYPTTYPIYPTSTPYNSWTTHPWRPNKERDINHSHDSMQSSMPLIPLIATPAEELSNIQSKNPVTSYKLQEEIIGDEFFKRFQFYTGKDLANGFVEYLDERTARELKLVFSSDKNFIMKVDSSDYCGPNGRKTVRIESRDFYEEGVYVLDVNHIPEGCTTWPVFWSLGEGEWPNGGHIEILTGTNLDLKARSSLRTSHGCNMHSVTDDSFDGKWITSTRYCSFDANNYSGCSSEANKPSLGSHINKNNGAIIVMEIQKSSHIKIWIFLRDEAPKDIGTEELEIWNWKEKPVAHFKFGSNCDGNSKISRQRFVIHTNLCGDWAGNVFPDTCAKEMGEYNHLLAMETCKQYVMTMSQSFDKAYWDIASFRYYRQNGNIMLNSNPKVVPTLAPTDKPKEFSIVDPISTTTGQPDDLSVTVPVSDDDFVLKKVFSGSKFVDNFNFLTIDDPDSGYVNFVDENEAAELNLYSRDNKFVMKADTSDKKPDRGRNSLWIRSKEAFGSSILTLDVEHMPEGCGVWPSIFLSGEKPVEGTRFDRGQIDIVDGNLDSPYVLSGLHTTSNCKINPSSADMDGDWIDTDCVDEPNTIKKGCFCQSQTPGSYGSTFNVKKGGLFVVEFNRLRHIKMWFYPRDEIPGEFMENTISPKKWTKKPYAHFPFSDDCIGTQKFGFQKINVKTNFCGEHAAELFNFSCRKKVTNRKTLKTDCEKFVQDFPEELKDAFWKLNSFKVYQRVSSVKKATYSRPRNQTKKKMQPKGKS